MSAPNAARHRSGVIVLHTPHRDRADALADVFTQAGYATIWQNPGRPTPVVHGVVAGLWDGAQLCDHEVNELAAFCKYMSRGNAPVVALLDFPRRDRVDLAYTAGASAVLGKPWRNSDLISMTEAASSFSPQQQRAA